MNSPPFLSLGPAYTPEEEHWRCKEEEESLPDLTEWSGDSIFSVGDDSDLSERAFKRSKILDVRIFPTLHIGLVGGAYMSETFMPDEDVLEHGRMGIFMLYIHRLLDKHYPHHVYHLHTFSGGPMLLIACELFLQSKYAYQSTHRLLTKDDKRWIDHVCFDLTIHYHRMHMRMHCYDQTWMEVESLIVEKMMLAQSFGAHVEYVEEEDIVIIPCSKRYDGLYRYKFDLLDIVFLSPFDGFCPPKQEETSDDSRPVIYSGEIFNGAYHKSEYHTHVVPLVSYTFS